MSREPFTRLPSVLQRSPDQGSVAHAGRQVAPMGTRVFVDAPEWLDCSICMEVVRDPSQLNGGCSHVFCKSCLLRHMQRSRSCPECRAAPMGTKKPIVQDASDFLQSMLPVEELMIESLPTRRVLDDMKVHCRFGLARTADGGWAQGDGPELCPEVLPLKDIPSHEKACAHRPQWEEANPATEHTVGEGEGRLVSAGADQQVRVWRLVDGVCERVVEGHSVLGMCGGPNPGSILSAEHDGVIRVWDMDQGVSTMTLKGHKDWVTGVAVLPGKRVASASDDESVRVWSTEGGGECILVLQGHEDRVNCVAALGEDRLLSGSDDRTVRVWSLAGEGKCERVLEGHTGAVKSVTALPDGRIASSSADGYIRLWAAEGDGCEVLEGHEDQVKCVASIGGGRLASTSSDTTIRIWKLRDDGGADTIQVLRGHGQTVRVVIPLGDQRVVTAGADCTVRVWRVADGVCERVLEGHSGYVGGIAVLK